MEDYTDITVVCVDGSVRWSKYVISINCPALCPLYDMLQLPISVSQMKVIMDVINGINPDDDGAVFGAIIWALRLFKKNVVLGLFKAYKYGTDIREKIKDFIITSRSNSELFAFMCRHFSTCIADLIVNRQIDINDYPICIVSTARTAEDLFTMSRMIKLPTLFTWEIIAGKFANIGGDPSKNKHWYGCTISYMIISGADKKAINCMMAVRNHVVK